MSANATQQAALLQLGGVPGVVGSMVFEPSGSILASAFPPVFDTAALKDVATQLSADGYFQEWVGGEQSALDLRYADGRVVVRPVAGSWLLVLCTAEANAQLLSMSLTQVVRRLGASPASAKPPDPLDRLRAVVAAELGDHAAQALEILAVAGTTRKQLVRAAEEVEKMTRLFISKKKAEEIAKKMREVLDA